MTDAFQCCKMWSCTYRTQQSKSRLYFRRQTNWHSTRRTIFGVIIIDESLKCRKQCAKAVNAANATLGMIKRSFVNREKPTILSLYKSVVRPKLEYCIQAWRPHLAKDIELMERVQHRATKLISSLRKETYENRVKILGLTTLETRRLRGDLVEAFKVMKGFEDISWNKFFKMSLSKQLRGQST